MISGDNTMWLVILSGAAGGAGAGVSLVVVNKLTPL